MSKALALVDALPKENPGFRRYRYAETVNGCTVAASQCVVVAIRGDAKPPRGLRFGHNIDEVRRVFAVTGRGRWLRTADVRAAVRNASAWRDTRLEGTQRLIRIDGVPIDARLLEPVLRLAGRWCGVWIRDDEPPVFTGEGWCVGVSHCTWAPRNTPRVTSRMRRIGEARRA